jgi:hypothetical protein
MKSSAERLSEILDNLSEVITEAVEEASEPQIRHPRLKLIQKRLEKRLKNALDQREFFLDCSDAGDEVPADYISTADFEVAILNQLMLVVDEVDEAIQELHG